MSDFDLKDAITAVKDADAMAFKDVIQSAIADKISTAVDYKKMELAGNILNTGSDESGEVEADLDLETETEVEPDMEVSVEPEQTETPEEEQMKTFKEFISLEESSIEEQICLATEDVSHQEALLSLYENLNDENKVKFEERLESDKDKLIEFALSKVE